MKKIKVEDKLLDAIEQNRLNRWYFPKEKSKDRLERIIKQDEIVFEKIEIYLLAIKKQRRKPK
jgi:hypothetical protein